MYRFSKASEQLTILLVLLLPFLIPFDAYRNIDMQGLMLLIAGSAAVITLVASRAWVDLDNVSLSLLGIYTLACVVSLSNGGRYTLLGAPYIRLGALGLIACLCCGLVLQKVTAGMLLRAMYMIMCLIAAISVPYTLVKFHSLHRISGLVAQADVLGVLVAIGVIIGWYLLYCQWQKRLVIVGQVLLLLILVLTATRVAIGLTLIFSIVYGIQFRPKVSTNRLLITIFLFCALFATAQYYSLSRLTNISYASESIAYRLDLQTAALHASADKPLRGYGAGNVADALDCKTLTTPVLHQTCADGYFFNSSHNIFLDRVLAVGWLGGLSFVAIIALAMYRASKGNLEAKIFASITLFISLYYITNVTSVVLELLLWITIMQCLRTNRA